MLHAAIERDEVDWIATTAYYARYFSWYALMQDIGVTSEIHDCSIAFLEAMQLLDWLLKELVEAKRTREQLQYYFYENKNHTIVRENAEQAFNFVVTMESFLDSSEIMNRLRKQATSIF